MKILPRLAAYLTKYVHFADPAIVLPLSLWIIGTYAFEAFDAYPYLVITARTKRSGKTRLSELVGFAANMPFNVSGASAPALFRKIADDKPTVIWDEAEQLSSEANNLLRSFLNVGYRKGQTIPRATGDGMKEWPTYCPKAFVLIGDVYDTLRDRSLIVEMQRGDAPARFLYETAKAEGLEVADQIRAELAAAAPALLHAYTTVNLDFLTDRDAEIWSPIFALVSILAPEYNLPLTITAADLCAAKTNPVRYVETADAETVAAKEEYGRMALRDLITIFGALRGPKPCLSSADAVEALKQVPTGPWRKFYAPGSAYEAGKAGRYNVSEGLTVQQLSDLLRPYGVAPKLLRLGKAVFRGYDARDVLAAGRKARLV